ncbi:arm repeat-containing protein [Chrysochromulina tobinii]|uniref:RING-type E3 ubiquitin transferase n=1 Tax=Chrysochromulina tobinii TaxID=1460289 RepID=A0A0M0JR83_9EUKA|nr:arm repeat-containing protein [Chrysochromulina tobinii]|eukprot:KOO28965.1 arm repeat-containing protein [Chrysochromulina sp. CCMP291]
MLSRQVPLAERVALTLERHAKELCELTNRHMSADEREAVALAIPILVQLLKGGHGASAAALAIDHLAVNSAANKNAIREAGAIAPLVAMLQAGAGSEAATNAAGALCCLAISNDTNRNAICEAGAIAPLVVLLQAGAGSKAATNAAAALWSLANSTDSNRNAICEAGAIAPLVVLLQAGAGSKAATNAAGALWNLATSNDTNKNAICEAGAIAPLVALLQAGTGSEAATKAAGALRNLATSNDTNRNAIREAGAIAPLVVLLQAGAGSEAAMNAAGALRNLSDSPTCCLAILVALANAATPLDAFPYLQRKLRSVATERLQRTEAGEDAAALEAALAMATAMGTTDEAMTARVHLRLVELRTAATRRARRESVGLNVALPADFTCPITYDKMKDPVVASDGHSYERSAIEEVLRGPHPISPLTRATLGTALAKKRGRAGVEGEDEDDDEEGQHAPKRRASSRRSS